MWQSDIVPNLWIQAACPLGEKVILKNALYFILKGRFHRLARKQITEEYVFKIFLSFSSWDVKEM